MNPEVAVIAKEEIQEGDRIYVYFESRRGNGTTTRVHGTVVEKDGDGDWQDSANNYLTYMPGMEVQEIHLAERPKPPLPTEPGSVFRATEIRGQKCDTLIMTREPVEGHGPGYVSAHWVRDTCWHDPEDITAWEPLEGMAP